MLPFARNDRVDWCDNARVETLRGLAYTIILALNTIFCVGVLMPFALVKFAIPVDAVRKPLDRLLNAIAVLWIANNSTITRDVRWDVRGVEGLSRKRWYLVEANHQSWADIFVLQKVLTGRIPLLKFFLKRQLIWVPLIGAAWWALDFPFMKRHSQEFLRRHPERRGDDLAAIRRSCEKFSLIPTAVMNFLEGTRFTPEKQNAEGSPYRHLLAPKAGGIGLALNAMGERFHSLLDITLFYPGGAPSFFGLLAGRVKEVVVQLRELPIPTDLTSGNYAADPHFRARVQEWVAELWREKDQMLEQLRLEHGERSA
jgi:1-acyl-sn-glycerol-3-phosphate acyltransferase